MLSEEGGEYRPKIAVIAWAFRAAMSDASEAVGLAWDACRPDGSLVRPPSDPERARPSANTGEEMALAVSSQVVGSNKSNVSLIYVAWCDVADGNEIPEPLRCMRVVFVVVRTVHRGIRWSEILPSVMPERLSSHA